MELPKSLFPSDAFSCALEFGYGAIVHGRWNIEGGNRGFRISQAKARVAPGKSALVPRPELSATILVVTVVHITRSRFKYADQAAALWTDSPIVLYCIRKFNTVSASSQLRKIE